MFSFVGSFIVNASAKLSASLLTILYSIFGKNILNTILNILAKVWNLITTYVWIITQWVLWAIDALQMAIMTFLGINEYKSFGDYVEGLKSINAPGNLNYFDHLMKVFRAVAVVAIILMIVFTIFSIIMQEYKQAFSDQGKKQDNSKGKIFKSFIVGIIAIVLMPLTFYTIIAGTNSILYSFYRALGNDSDVTIGGQVLAAATYDANRYRAYANSDKRIPITIEVYKTENDFGNPLTESELQESIQNKNTQDSLKAIAGAFANNSFLSFEKSTVYSNGQWESYKNYSINYNDTIFDDMGQYFENFICTREQYYVMAEFIDYCQLHNINYYIKEIKESDICWKYVDSIYPSASEVIDEKGNAIGDFSLEIKYRDAEEVNSPENLASAADSSSGSQNYYSLQLSTKLDLTSPVSDALTTISQLLGVDENSSLFNAMERDDSGDYVNLVSWANEKVMLRTSENFKLTNPSTWTYSDQIIVYEYYHFDTNNTLGNYTIEALKDGITLDACELKYRNFNSNTQTYSQEYSQYCVKLNGSYYRIEPSEETDNYGMPYYILSVPDREVDYYENSTISIKKNGTQQIKLSSNFNINNKNSWNFGDQILVYEYYKDLTLSNEIRRNHRFSDFSSGVLFDKYSITEGNSTKEYVYINGTFYQTDGLSSATNDFLIDTEAARERYFCYELSASSDEKTKYGIGNLNSLLIKSTSMSTSTLKVVENTDAMYSKYSNINMKFSKNFSFDNSDTWTYRDYAIFYFFINTLADDKSTTLDSLKIIGIDGTIVHGKKSGSSTSKYYLEVQIEKETTTSTVYIDLEEFEKISESKITQALSPTLFSDLGLDIANQDFSLSYNESKSTDKLLSAKTESHMFKFSEKFDEYSPKTWTVGDYFLIYLIDTKILDTTYSLIKVDGYSSLVYKYGSSVYYRFGASNGDAFFLDESKLPDGYDVDKWFKTNFLAYVLSENFNVSSSESSFAVDDLFGGSSVNPDSYIYDYSTDYTTDYTDPKLFLRKMGEEIVNRNTVFDDLTQIQYSYSNPAIIETDLSTWTYVDMYIYAATGTVPTPAKPYKSYLTCDNNSIYLIVGDYYVKIFTNGESLNNCLSANNKLITRQILSTGTKQFNYNYEFDDYCSKYFGGTVVNSVTSGSGVHDSEFIADNEKYVYYSDRLKKVSGSSTTTATIETNKIYSIFELLLIYQSTSLTTTGFYQFDGYTKDGVKYIKLKNNVYVAISNYQSSDFYYSENSIIGDKSRLAFSHDDSNKYTSFKNNGYTAYDAILYTVTGSTESKEYNIFTIDESSLGYPKYIYVDGKIVSYYPTLAVLTTVNVGADSEKYIDFLYKNFYKNRVSTSQPILVADSGITNTDGKISVPSGFIASDSSTWTAINVILHTLEINLSGGNIEGIIYLNSNGGYVLKCKNTTTSVDYYIDLSGIVNVSIERNQTNSTISTVKMNDCDRTILQLHLKNSYKSGDEIKIRQTSQNMSIDDFVGGNNIYKDGKGTYEGSLFDDGFYDDEEGLFDVLIDEWTYFGVIYNYLYENKGYAEDTDKATVSLYWHNGETYLAFAKGMKTYLLNEIDDMNRPFFDSSYWEIERLCSDSASSTIKSLCSDFIHSGSTLENVLLSKFWDKENTTIEKYTSKSLCFGAGDIVFYWFFDLDNKEFAVYGLSEESNRQMKYVKMIANSVTGKYTESSLTTNVSEATNFIFKTKDIVDVDEWNIVDFLVAYNGGSSYGETISSLLYNFNGKNYIKNNGLYILLPGGSYNISAENAYQGTLDFNSANSMLNCISKGKDSKHLLYLYNRANEQIDGSIISYTSTETNSYFGTVKNNIEKFENEYLTENRNGEFEVIGFSDQFDPSDFSTWTVTDYIVYYAFMNDFYKDETNRGSDTFEFVLPFTYIPNFTKSSTDYYNMTYFDIVLAAAGKESNKDEYIIDELEDAYHFNLCYSKSGDVCTYYIKIPYHVNSTTKYLYAKICEEISIDFKNMSIVSKKLDGSLNETDLQDRIESFKDATTGYYISSGTFTEYKTTFIGSNFQTVVNSMCAPAYVHYLYKEDEKTGSVNVYKTIALSGNKTGTTGTYFDYDIFYEYYNRSIASTYSVVKVNDLTIDISTDVPDSSKVDFFYKAVYDKIYPDFVFYDYYYYILDAGVLGDSAIQQVNSNQQEMIKNGEAENNIEILNLRLSKSAENFKLTNPSEWTLLDFIILYEYSRDVRHNKFGGLSLAELSQDYFVNVYVFSSDIILYINGNFYNLNGIVNYSLTKRQYENINTSSVMLNSSNFATHIGTTCNLNNLITTASESGYNIKVLKDEINFSINPTYSGSRQYKRTANNTSFTVENTTYFRNLDMNVVYTNYKINTENFGTYSTSNLIKKVSWVEKLMTDMQVYYPDLNWGTLIATDGWLDTLGEFVSAYSSGLYVSDNGSANTTAAGLVLSEFFMSVATPVENSYANYEYSSLFDEETIHSLMLSIMGEENYNALVLESRVFMDFFNSCFAPIIDDFALEFGEDIGENSLRLCAYKSYLATLLLSSDIGEYLYTLATRVYAEYTICEYLARSAGDYSGYYSYVNQIPDTDGNIVDAYKYGTFAELTNYENEFCGNSTPSFSFNYKNAFDLYKDEDDGGILGYTYEETLSDSKKYSQVVYKLVNYMNKDYEEIYSEGYVISNEGRVVDADGVIVNLYKQKTYVYCYMIHVYWSIKHEINGKREPVYLENYKEYLTNGLKRWSIMNDLNVDGVDQYFQEYDDNVKQLKIYQNLTLKAAAKIFMPTLQFSGDEDEDPGFWEIVKELAKFLVDCISGNFDNAVGDEYITIPFTDCTRMFENSSYLNDLQYVLKNVFTVYCGMGTSRDSGFSLSDIVVDVIKGIFHFDIGVEEFWNDVLKYNESLENIIAELQKVREILPGQTTEAGSVRSLLVDSKQVNYTDNQIDYIISTFQNLKNNVTQYIAIQTRVDKLQKRSITFTLAQYGANYVSTGYNFSVKNKEYNFKSTIDPSRIAEYVYGGSFLESVGVGAQYTSPDFDGIIKAKKVYDPNDKAVKTELNAWAELRAFASKLADETAELYFMTNLGDLSIHKKNAVYLSDYVMVGSVKQTLEQLVFEKVNNMISTEVSNRILEGKEDSHEKFIAVSQYIFNYEVAESELEDITFEDYKRIVIRKLIDNDQNKEETAEERARKYMALYTLLGCEIDFSANNKDVGRIIPKANITRNGNNALVYEENVSNYSAVCCETPEFENYASGGLSLAAQWRESYNTGEVVKNLSGLVDRPNVEILTREYSGTRTQNYFDEAYGDSFILCTYKDGLYYPVLATGSRNYSSDRYNAYVESGVFDDSKFVLDYYGEGAYTIVAKGIITANGMPTAIRKYNNPIAIETKKFLRNTTTIYNPVTFYRTMVGGNFGSGKDLINTSRAVSRVTTKNYTKYIEGTSFTKGIGESVTYTGRTNLKTFIASDYEVNFVQTQGEYLIGQSDDFGAINVLDQFSYFYVFGGQTWILLILSFVTIIPIMINALGGAMKRILDLTVLFIISPLVVSTKPLYYDGKNSVFDKWKKDLMGTMFSVFGYVIGFSSYFIVVPMVYSTNSLISVETFNSIVKIGGIGNYFNYSTINSLLRCLWIITAVTIIKMIPKLLLPIITAQRGDLDKPDPPMGRGEEFTKRAKELVGDLKQMASKLSPSGAAMMGAKKAIMDEALMFVPGGKIIKDVIVDPAVKKANSKADSKEQKEVETALINYGVDETVAKSAGKDLVKYRQEARKRKKDQKENDKKAFLDYIHK